MKKLMLGLLLLVFIQGEALCQERAFQSRKEMNKYIFQNTNLRKLTKGYFLDFVPNFTPESKLEFFKKMENKGNNKSILLSFLDMIESTDITQQYEMDSLLFPIMDEYYSNYGSNKLNIPLIIGDIDFSFVNENAFHEIFEEHIGDEPFSTIKKDQILDQNVTVARLFADTLINNDIRIYWNDDTYFSNTDRRILKVEMFVDGEIISLPKNTEIPLNRFYSEKKPVREIKFKLTFSDETYFEDNTKLLFIFSDNFRVNHTYYPSDENHTRGNENINHYLWDYGFFTIRGNIDSDDPAISVSENTLPDLNIQVYWGCDPVSEEGDSHPHILDKPYIIVSGWGPYTDRFLINWNQGWPSTLQDFYWSINQKGFIDSLVGSGYDVVFAKFYPPNASILKNSKQLEQLINLVNEEKFYNESYQENVISGYSAGSMCVRLTLERMEKENLANANNPHHHCKLYVSFDGEHGGANVPLGIQHSVEYLWNYHAPFGGFFNLKVYGLHYILNAPLSKELLRYFYTETGSPNNPGQGPHWSRQYYYQHYNLYNHTKNTDNPGYPAFTRNISISNGTSVRKSTSPPHTFYPYNSLEGRLIFKNDQNSLFKKEKTEVYLSGTPSGLVFKNEKKPWFHSWEIRMEKVTKNPYLLDNAPGGTTFLADPNGCDDPNIMYQVLNRMEKKTGGSKIIAYNAMYSFTPTVLTHDIRNFPTSYSSNYNGIPLNYDMKAEGLMYTSIDDVGNTGLASHFYGYPHLAHPNDHYSEYTPFDAVFAWDQENTVHIQSGRAQWNNNENHGSSCSNNKNHQRWEQQDAPIVRTKIRSFILGEADVYNAYIQNRKYGWNANPNYVYKADIVSKYNIFAGDSVTQRTDFRPVTIDNNGEIRFIACHSITLKPGFHAKIGSEFHAKIDQDQCRYCGASDLPTHPTTPNYFSGYVAESNASQVNKKVGDLNIVLYPNPSNGQVHLKIEEDIDYFTYCIYDLNGRLINEYHTKGNIVEFKLPKGFYIIKIKTENQWTSKKLIIY